MFATQEPGSRGVGPGSCMENFRTCLVGPTLPQQVEAGRWASQAPCAELPTAPHWRTLFPNPVAGQTAVLNLTATGGLTIPYLDPPCNSPLT